MRYGTIFEKHIPSPMSENTLYMALSGRLENNSDIKRMCIKGKLDRLGFDFGGMHIGTLL